jgi:hypothetical protein
MPTALSPLASGNWAVHALAADGTTLCGQPAVMPDPLGAKLSGKRILCKNCDWLITQIEAKL